MYVCSISRIYTVNTGFHLRYIYIKKKQIKKSNAPSFSLRCPWQRKQIQYTAKIRASDSRKRKSEKAKEKAVNSVFKNKREKANKAPRDVPYFTNDSRFPPY